MLFLRFWTFIFKTVNKVCCLLSVVITKINTSPTLSLTFTLKIVKIEIFPLQMLDKCKVMV